MRVGWDIGERHGLHSISMVQSFLEKIWSLQNWSDTISSFHSISFSLANTWCHSTWCQIFVQLSGCQQFSQSLDDVIYIPSQWRKNREYSQSTSWNIIHPSVSSLCPYSRMKSSCCSLYIGLVLSLTFCKYYESERRIELLLLE